MSATVCEATAACRTACGLGPRSSAATWLRRLVSAERARAELNRMTDVELKDIGLTRGEIGAVADGQYRR